VSTNQLLKTVSQFKNEIQNDKTIIFSHNNVYMSDFFMMTPMIRKDIVEATLGNKIILFNGHIHRSHYETNYYQVGSAIPTSFKEQPVASGICLYKDNKVQTLRNNKVLLLSISNPDYIPELEWYFSQALEYKSLIFLRVGKNVESVVMKLLNTYKEIVPGIMFDSQKHT
jgi:hypothetical protein